MTSPLVRTYIDWDDLTDGSGYNFLADTRARMRSTILTPINITRGRSLDFAADATGQATFKILVGRPDGSYPRAVLMTPGLVGYWPLGELAGTVAANLTGSGAGAYVAAPTLGATGPLTGDTTTAVTFAAASSQYVNVPYAAALHPGNTFSVAAWMKRTAGGHLDPIASAGTNDLYFTIGADDKVRLTKEGGADIFVSTSTYADTNWHHYIATKAGVTTVVYRDGAAIAGTVTDQTVVAAAGAIRFGAAVSSAVYANATVAHAALWNRALTSTEVTALYGSGTRAPIFPGYDKVGRGDIMLGRRVLVLADYTATTDKPLFSGRISRMNTDPATLDIDVVAQDDFAALSYDLPTWLKAEATFRELRMDVVRRMQTHTATHNGSLASVNPNGGASRSYWTSVPVNRVDNPGFETNTTGWSVATDAKCTSAGVSITRTSGGKHGSYRGAALTNAAAGSKVCGTWYDLSAYTFTAGVTYRWSLWARAPYMVQPMAAIYSNGTPTDFSQVDDFLFTEVTPTTWHNYTGTWTPTADRADAHISFRLLQTAQATLDVDSVSVWVVDSNEGAWYETSYADPLISSVAKESVVTRQTGTGPYGLGTFLRGAAASGASIAMPFYQPGAFVGGVAVGRDASGTFAGGTQYTATAQIRGVGTGGLVLGKGDATPVTGSTVTLHATNWAQVHVHWTNGGAVTDEVWLVAQSTGATIEVGGVVLTSGSTVWDWCPTVGMDGLDTAEDAMRVCRVTPSGRPLDVLRELNAASFSRHWCEPLAAFPWWRYRSRVLSSLAGKATAETYADDLASYTGLTQGYEALINVVNYTTGTTYFNGSGVFTDALVVEVGEVEDAASVALYGRIAATIGNQYLEWRSTAATTTIPAYILDTYAAPRLRFSVVVENRWPSQLLRELDELVVLTIPRLGVIAVPFIITGIAHEIAQGGFLWRTTYQVEQAPG